MIKLSVLKLSVILSIIYVEGAGAISLSEAQRTAVENNLQIKAQEKEVESKASSLTRARSAFYPRLGAETRYEFVESDFEKFYGGTSNLFVEWNLFNGFQDFTSQKASAMALESAQIKLDQLKASLLWEVEVAFYRILHVQTAIKLYNSALDRNSSQKKLVANRKAAGLVSEADVMEFELYESFLRSELASLEGDRKDAQTQLKVLLGKETSDIQIELVGAIPKESLVENLESVVKNLKELNAELKIGELAVAQSRQLKSVASGGFLPKVDFISSYGSLGLRETDVSPESYFGVVARWEFFSGFDTIAARKEAHARLVQAESALKVAKINVQGEAEKIFAQLKALEYRLELEKRNLTNSEKYLRAISDEYRRGVKNSSDLRGASDNLLQVLLRDNQYRFDFIDQKVSLQKLLGRGLTLTEVKESVKSL